MASTVNDQDPVCEMCGVESNRQCLVACSKCGCLKHIYCMEKPMLEPPKEWECDECQEKTQDILALKDVNEGVEEFSVCPSKNCSWIGKFMINQEGFIDFKCHLKAYTPPTTTKRICEISSNMPKEIQLTVAARTTLETNIFSASPTKCDIGLFFFCGDDIECTRYQQILEQLNANDRVMRGLINNKMELVVLSSKILPLGSQYWLGRFYMWAIFQPIQNYKKICKYNAVPVQPDPMFVIGMNKKKSSRVGPDPMPSSGRRSHLRVGKKGSSHLPSLPLTPAMSYVTPPSVNVVQSDPMPVTGRNTNVVQPLVPVTRKIRNKSSREVPPPLPPTPAINDNVPPPMPMPMPMPMPAMNVVQSDPMPDIGKNMNVVQPDPMSVIGKIKKKSSQKRKMASFLPPPLSPAPDMNYVAPPTPHINNAAAPLPLPSFPYTSIINYIIVPGIGNRGVIRRGSRNCWDQNRMA